MSKHVSISRVCMRFSSSFSANCFEMLCFFFFFRDTIYFVFFNRRPVSVFRAYNDPFRCVCHRQNHIQLICLWSRRALARSKSCIANDKHQSKKPLVSEQLETFHSLFISFMVQAKCRGNINQRRRILFNK